jgi:hypothetical protein
MRNVMWGSTSSLTHNTAGSLYLTQCTFAAIPFNKTGTGYVQLQDCDLGSASAISVTGAGQFVINGGMASNITLNNASALVSAVGCLNVRAITVTAGIFSSKSSVIYSNGGTANAIAAASGTTVYLFETAVYTPSAAPARISLAGFWSVNSSQYDRTNSTLTGTNISTVTHFDHIQTNGSVITTPKTVATLGSAAMVGARSFVTDANSTTFATVVVGGGSNRVPVYSNGTNWLIG